MINFLFKINAWPGVESDFLKALVLEVDNYFYSKSIFMVRRVLVLYIIFAGPFYLSNVIFDILERRFTLSNDVL